MDRDTYNQWSSHPLRSILRACATERKYLPTKQQLKEQLEEAGIPSERHAGILLVAERIAERANADGMRSKTEATQLADEKSLELVQHINNESSLLKGSDHPPSRTGTSPKELAEAIYKDMYPGGR